MNRTTNTPVRPYRSQLRTEQSESTRARILDAAVRVMARGIASLSMPAVAREARVSTRTVYHHFRTKEDLLGALYLHLVSRARLDEIVLPRTLDDLRDGIRAIFGRVESLGDLARAAIASPAAEEARRLNIPVRLAQTRELADRIAPRISDVDKDRIARFLLILTTTSSMRLWREHLGSSVDEAADDIDWLIRAAIAASGEA
jgi:AcrR family transcriptional regulator